MKTFKTKVEDGGDVEYEFQCYENTEPIEIGDKFLFFFAGIADIGVCQSEHEKEEINQNDRIRDKNSIDFVTGFWKKCYKIKSTNFDYKLMDI
jgi:hypothetical protein